MWVQQIQVRSNRLSSPQARSRIQERVSLLWWCPSLTEPTYLSDLQITVVCLKIPLFCLQIRRSPLLAYRHVFLHNRSRTGVLQALYRHRLSPFHAIRASCVVLVAHKLTAKFTDPTYHQLVMLTSMSICPPCIYMQSQAQSAGHCLFIYLASLATSSSSAGILWSRWHSWK